MHPSSTPDLEHRFIAYLAGLAGTSPPGDERTVTGKEKNLAALAALRRGLGKRPGEAAEMFPYVMPFIGDRLPQSRQNDYFLVAALFAAHQLIWHHPAGPDDRREPTNLGASFRRLHAAFESGSIEKRLVAVLNASRDDLPEHLRHAISLLHAHDIPVDWLQLLRDLAGWDSDLRGVQRAWARAYWRVAPTPSPSPAPTLAPASAPNTP